MAITSNPIRVVPVPVDGNEWAKSMYTLSAADEEVLIAGEAGKYHYIKKIMVRCQTTTDVTIGSGAAGTMTTIHLGPIPLNAASGTFIISFGERGMECDLGLALVIITSGAAPIMIYVEGKTCLN